MLAVLLLPALGAAPAVAQSGSGLRVTIAARSCPSYEAITANLARNDIQESLQDLGADTLYTSGQPIDPDLEAQGQPTCNPLPDWQFTLGRGYQSRAVTGTWGSLSIVTGPFPDAIETDASVPLLNDKGTPTGRQLLGATTITLTAEQAALAGQANALWLQGGTTTDPVLNQRYPGQYGFGALRCAVDNLNGDNVEFIAFPTGATHVFCYAYYVTPPPTSGTIVVRKALAAPAETASHTFEFSGNLSFNADNTFTLDAAPGQPGEQTFYRAAVPAGGTPWTFSEVPQDGWSLTGLTCSSSTGASRVNAAAGSVTVYLVGGDTVTCTYTNTLTPPAAGLLLGKVTLGDTGRTVFDVSGPTPPQTVSTAKPRIPAFAPLLPLPPGDYTVDETPVPTPAGRWERRQVRCQGRIVPNAPDPLPVTLSSSAGTFCTWVNEFVPDGGIRIRKRTFGATGTAGFIIRRRPADTPEVYEQQATTTAEGTPVTAVGDSTRNIALGSYDIQETGSVTSNGGRWRLETVVCNGVPVGSAQGLIRIRLTAEQPRADCLFTNRFEPGGTDGGGGGGGTTDPVPETNLSVTKRRVTTGRVLIGDTVPTIITVRNRSRTRAENVLVHELLPRSARRLRVSAPRGVRCRTTRPIICRVGDLAPGARVRFTVATRPGGVGRIVNRVAVHGTTRETTLRDNVARAAIRVRRLPRFTG